jgi:cell division protein ZapA (FtsZ GTPase activity inhibitor)
VSKPDGERLRVTIANRSVDVTICGDAETTERLAREVTARFREIEADSARIDTQAFALQTAYTYAVELQEAQQQASEDTRDLVKALDVIASRLRDLLEVLESSGQQADTEDQ